MDVIASLPKYNPGVLEDYYSCTQTELGSGAFSTVVLVTNLETGIMYAAKKISRLETDIYALAQELESMNAFRHENVMEFVEFFTTEEEYIVIFELVEGGELLDAITKIGHFTERVASTFFKQAVLALLHVHNAGYVHRDVKPENLLLNNKDLSSAKLKLADYGFCTRYHGPMHECLGTPPYMSPELSTQALFYINGGVWDDLQADESTSQTVVSVVHEPPPHLSRIEEEYVLSFRFTPLVMEEISETILPVSSREELIVEESFALPMLQRPQPKEILVVEESFKLPMPTPKQQVYVDASIKLAPLVRPPQQVVVEDSMQLSMPTPKSQESPKLDKMCASCRVPVKSMFCTKCGAKPDSLPEKSIKGNYCNLCQSRLDASQTECQKPRCKYNRHVEEKAFHNRASNQSPLTMSAQKRVDQSTGCSACKFAKTNHCTKCGRFVFGASPPVPVVLPSHNGMFCVYCKHDMGNCLFCRQCGMKTVNKWTEIPARGVAKPSIESVVEEIAPPRLEVEVLPSIKLQRPTKQVLMMDRLGSVRMIEKVSEEPEIHLSDPSLKWEIVEETSTVSSSPLNPNPNPPPYTQKVDVWALGIVLYLCLIGSHPWECNRDDCVKQFETTLETKIDWENPVVKHLSPQARDLLYHMLDHNPNTRYSMEQCLHHCWIEHAQSLPDEVLVATQKNLRSYQARKAFVGAVNAVKGANAMMRLLGKSSSSNSLKVEAKEDSPKNPLLGLVLRMEKK